MRASLLVVLPVIAVEVAVRGANEQIKCHVPKNTLQIYDLFEYQQRIWEKMWGVPLFSAWPSRTFCKGKEKVLEGLLENKGWLFLNKGALLENNLGLLWRHTRHNKTPFLHAWYGLSLTAVLLLDEWSPASWRLATRFLMIGRLLLAGGQSSRSRLFSLKGYTFFP